MPLHVISIIRWEPKLHQVWFFPSHSLTSMFQVGGQIWIQTYKVSVRIFGREISNLNWQKSANTWQVLDTISQV